MRGVYAIKTSSSIGSVKNDKRNLQAAFTKPVSLVFKDMKCTNLPPADVDGLADPYIMFMWDPISLIGDDRARKNRKTKSGFDSNKWPVTAYRKKNLNPEWPEEVKLNVPETIPTEMEGAMLYLTIWDYDLNTADDMMGSIVLNLKDLTALEDGKKEKEIKIDQPLLKYGLEQGRIQGTIVVRRGNIHNKNLKSGQQGIFTKMMQKMNSAKMLMSFKKKSKTKSPVIETNPPHTENGGDKIKAKQDEQASAEACASTLLGKGELSERGETVRVL